MLSCRLLLTRLPQDREAGYVDCWAGLGRTRTLWIMGNGHGAHGKGCYQGKCRSVSWDIGESLWAPCYDPSQAQALQRACAGSCLSCFSEVQAGLWDLWWYPLKANLRSGVGIKIYIGLPALSLPAYSVFFSLLSGTWRFMRRIQTAQRAPLPPRRWSAGDCLRNGSSVTMLSWTERRGHLQKRFFTGHEAKDVPGYLLNGQLFGLCSQHRLVTALYMSCLAYPV